MASAAVIDLSLDDDDDGGGGMFDDPDTTTTKNNIPSTSTLPSCSSNNNSSTTDHGQLVSNNNNNGSCAKKENGGSTTATTTNENQHQNQIEKSPPPGSTDGKPSSKKCKTTKNISHLGRKKKRVSLVKLPPVPSSSSSADQSNNNNNASTSATTSPKEQQEMTSYFSPTHQKTKDHHHHHHGSPPPSPPQQDEISSPNHRIPRKRLSRDDLHQDAFSSFNNSNKKSSPPSSCRERRHISPPSDAPPSPPLRQRRTSSLTTSNRLAAQDSLHGGSLSPKKRLSASASRRSIVATVKTKCLDTSNHREDRSPPASTTTTRSSSSRRSLAAAVPVQKSPSPPPRERSLSRAQLQYASTQNEEKRLYLSKDKTVGPLPSCPPKKETLDAVPKKAAAAKGDQEIIELQDSDDEHQQQQLQVEVDSRTFFFQKHCWNCEVRLRHPEDETEQYLYYLHAHPHLDVPCCCLCAEETRNVENDESCCGCARDEDDLQEEGAEDVLFLCDSEDCAYSMCGSCIVQANGNKDILSTLNDPDAAWICPRCQPPVALRSLQNHLRQLEKDVTEDEDGDDGGAQSPQKSNESAELREAKTRRLVHEVMFLEREKQEVQEELERDEERREEIAEELVQSGSVPEDKLDDRVEDEFQLWKEGCMDHEARVSDTIMQLGEKLNSLGFNINAYLNDLTPKEESTEDSEWKRFADDEIDRRHKEIDAERRKETKERIEKDKKERIRRKKEGKSNTPRVPETTDLEIEELASLDDDFELVHSNDITGLIPESTQGPPTWQDVEIAMEVEAEELERHPPRSFKRIRDSHDDKVLVKAAVKQVSKDHQKVARSMERSRRVQHRERSRGLDGHRTAQGHAKNSSQRQRHTQESPAAADADTYEDIAPFGRFVSSKFVLTRPTDATKIAVDKRLAKHLKSHQKEGIEFMFRNSFADLAADSRKRTNENIGGCILAHNMGLGKSLSTICLLHTVLSNPSLQDKNTGRSFIHSVVLIAPVNTLANWENEFEKWAPSLTNRIHSVADFSQFHRTRGIERWSKTGGVLLISDKLFSSAMKKKENERYLTNPGPDVIVLDEAHTMLKNKESKVFESLKKIPTKRRICLTGSPFQNNLFEYCVMVSYIQPGLLGSRRDFKKNYSDPITAGCATDAAPWQKQLCNEKLAEIKEKVAPYVHRKDASVLRKDLPSMQQVVLFIRATKLQRQLYMCHKKYCKQHAQNNFLRHYQDLRPIHNHPGTLTMNRVSDKTMDSSKTIERPSSTSTVTSGVEKNVPTVDDKSHDQKQLIVKQEPSDVSFQPSQPVQPSQPNDDAEADDMIIDLVSDSEGESDQGAVSDGSQGRWWNKVADKVGMSNFSNPSNGNKVVLLLHILAHAVKVNEKVVVFSHSIPTLDFIADVLALENWGKNVPAITSIFPGLGGWKLGRDFLRIDGSNSGAERGERIKEFNEDGSGSLKVFLISSKAGGIGINLCSANRVVLFDNHFNPTIDLQAVYRCYRYGQKKDVFVYRFLTEDSMEAKVYSRAVNKSALSLSLVDGKNLNRCFTQGEIDNLKGHWTWACCDRCDKWRVLPLEFDQDSLPEKWYCEMMNEHDKRITTDCEFPEQDLAWYEKHYKQPNEPLSGSTKTLALSGGNVSETLSDEKLRSLISRDHILQSLLDLSFEKQKNGTEEKKIVAKHLFHEVLLGDEDSEDTKAKTESKRSPGQIQHMGSKSRSPKSIKKRKMPAEEKDGRRNFAFQESTKKRKTSSESPLDLTAEENNGRRNSASQESNKKRRTSPISRLDLPAEVSNGTRNLAFQESNTKRKSPAKSPLDLPIARRRLPKRGAQKKWVRCAEI